MTSCDINNHDFCIEPCDCECHGGDMTASEASRFLDVPQQTVVRMISTGALEGAKIGRSYRVQSGSVLRAMERQGRLTRVT